MVGPEQQMLRTEHLVATGKRLGLGGIASILRLLAHINVFFPEPIKSSGSNYRCCHRHPPGQGRVNEVNIDKSAATYDD
jgi:hypothetical protein